MQWVFELTEQQADRLLTAVRAGELAAYGVAEGVILPTEESNRADELGSDGLELESTGQDAEPARSSRNRTAGGTVEQRGGTTGVEFAAPPRINSLLTQWVRWHSGLAPAPELGDGVEGARHWRPTARPPVAILTAFDDGADDGESVRIRSDRFVIGRTEGDFRVPHDGMLSARHVEITRQPHGSGVRWVVTDLQSRDGLFVRISTARLLNGAEFVVGGGRYRFDVAVAASERDPDVHVEKDLLGLAASKAPAVDGGWPALTELTPGGLGPRRPLSASEVWIGSDPARCGIVRADDQFCDPRHCRVFQADTGAWHLENTNTVNGVWLRVPRVVVEDVAYFQIGEQRFRLRV